MKRESNNEGEAASTFVRPHENHDVDSPQDEPTDIMWDSDQVAIKSEALRKPVSQWVASLQRGITSPTEIVALGVALLAVIGALTIVWWVTSVFRASVDMSPFLCAILVSAWFGGVRSGLLATGLSVLAIAQVFRPPNSAWGFGYIQMPTLVVFVLLSSFLVPLAAVQRKAFESLRSAHADLQRNNEALQAEHIEHEQAKEALRQSKFAQEKLRDVYEQVQSLSRKLLLAEEEERRHLARELHDEFGQLLATVNLHLHAVKGLAGESALPRLNECADLLQQAGEQIRNLVLELRPTMLDSLGLEAALRWLADHQRRKTGMDVQVVGHISAADHYSAELAIACFRVAQEALTNVLRHASAQHVRIELSEGVRVLQLVVHDDGIGFDVATTHSQAAQFGHLGLLGMKERVQIVGGSLDVQSQPGLGTRIRATFPWSNEGDQRRRPEA